MRSTQGQTATRIFQFLSLKNLNSKQDYRRRNIKEMESDLPSSMNWRVSGRRRPRVRREDEIQQRRTTAWKTWRGPARDLLQAERAMKVKGREVSQRYSVLRGGGREERRGRAGNLRPTSASRKGSSLTLWRTPRRRWRTTRNFSLVLLVAETEYWEATLSL